eukprot:9600031-Alexandrium_andersonii.AAC.1
MAPRQAGGPQRLPFPRQPSARGLASAIARLPLAAVGSAHSAPGAVPRAAALGGRPLTRHT